MKTLLSLTSRRFAMTRVRVFFQWEVFQGLPEWVTIDRSKWIIMCTREALWRLGNWCEKKARIAWCTLLVASSINTALAQSEQWVKAWDPNIAVPSENLSSLPPAPPTVFVSIQRPTQPWEPLSLNGEWKNVWAFTTDQVKNMTWGPNSPKTFGALWLLLDKSPEIISQLVEKRWEWTSPEVTQYDQINWADEGKIPELLLKTLTQVAAWEWLAQEASKVLWRPITTSDLIAYNKMSSGDQDKLSDAPNDLDIRIVRFIERAWSIAEMKIADLDRQIADLNSRIVAWKERSTQLDGMIASYRWILWLLWGLKKS